MENKNEENENKIILGNFNCNMNKWTGMVEIKDKDFIDAVPVMPSLFIMASGSMKKRERRFP